MVILHFFMSCETSFLKRRSSCRLLAFMAWNLRGKLGGRCEERNRFCFNCRKGIEDVLKAVVVYFGEVIGI